jgi:hypothetical protein
VLAAAFFTASQIGLDDGGSSVDRGCCVCSGVGLRWSLVLCSRILFVVFDSEGGSIAAVMVALWEFCIDAAGSDCAAAMVKDGSAHIDRLLELSRSAVTANTAITAAKDIAFNFHPLCVMAGRIEVGCGHFSDVMRQRRVISSRSITVHVGKHSAFRAFRFPRC